MPLNHDMFGYPYLHNRIRCLWVLILHNILLQGREWAFGVTARKGRSGVFAQKLVHDLAEQLMCDQRWVLMVADDYACDTFGPCVCVESVALLLDVLALACFGALGHGLGEE